MPHLPQQRPTFIKRLKQGLLVSLVAVLTALTFNLSSQAYSPTALYDEVWKLINTRFVDVNKNNQEWGIWRHRYDSEIQTEDDAYVAIQTMLASLNDRYTRFLDPDDFAEEGRSIQARLFGIGIQIGMREDKLVVISPIDDTPAFRAGLKANDEITAINGEPTNGMSVKDAANRIRGKKGTTVKLTIYRPNENKDKKGKEKIVEVTRDEIKLKAVTLKNPFDTKIPSNMGYIKISSFLSSNTSFELRNAMIKLGGKKGYIIDLRSNPGGLLSNAISISDFFLDGGNIVSTVDRGWLQRGSNRDSPSVN